jgi:WhiB family redox-sensing transcriptional regulator
MLDSRATEAMYRIELAELKYKALNTEPIAAVDWTKESACRGMEKQIFYGETRADVEEAKKVCPRCIVRLYCLKEAIVNNEEFGVWGGLEQKDLRTIRKIEPLGPNDSTYLLSLSY